MPQRPFEIWRDDTKVGSIASSDTVEQPIKPGHHTLRLRTGGRISSERSFDAHDGDVTVFACHGAGIWPIYVAAPIKRDPGIALKQE